MHKLSTGCLLFFIHIKTYTLSWYICFSICFSIHSSTSSLLAYPLQLIPGDIWGLAIAQNRGTLMVKKRVAHPGWLRSDVSRLVPKQPMMETIIADEWLVHGWLLLLVGTFLVHGYCIGDSCLAHGWVCNHEPEAPTSNNRASMPAMTNVQPLVGSGISMPSSIAR